MEFAFLFQDRYELLGDSGWVSWTISRNVLNPWLPHLSDFANFLNLEEIEAINSLFLICFVSAAFLLVGFYSRLFSLILFLGYLILVSTMPLFTYGKDVFLQIILFYFLFLPTGNSYSIDNYLKNLKKRKCYRKSHYSRLGLRVVQIHLCIVYLSAGIEKIFLPEWWNGETMWYALTQKDFSSIELGFLKNHPIIFTVLGIYVIAIEVSYFILMWIPKTRKIVLINIILIHLAIAISMKMPMFAALMIIINVCAWLPEMKKELSKIKAVFFHNSSRISIDSS
ncbi:HTTM domain-containing protein [Muricauda sp. MAR_2010_75]|uniref:HTTM domain-containing protein n=1 Tax=Allomuricauda sp. MAR_2010_75 TaxID=1250232 RepID=UPI0005695428|nr:HTTM domain-containing protein [Muricauda sp. MAR_2010_75]